MNFEIAPKETEIEANWYDASLYCFSLNINGKTGWRLPTKDELNQIYESENDLVRYGYWSSTNSGDSAWFQYFCTGSPSGNQIPGHKDTPFFYARPIRDLKDD